MRSETKEISFSLLHPTESPSSMHTVVKTNIPSIFFIIFSLQDIALFYPEEEKTY